MIAFTKVKLPFGWMGNMSSHPIVEMGVEWPTAEHLFQADRFTDPEIREKIRGIKNPMSAKICAKNTPIRGWWNHRANKTSPICLKF